jgi:hypothetical protein
MSADAIRRAEATDVPRLGALGGDLVRMHHVTDPRRFLLVDDVDKGYASGRALVDAMLKELEALGAKRIVPSTMVGNDAARRLFEACGFRPTMLEMTRGG